MKQLLVFILFFCVLFFSACSDKFENELSIKVPTDLYENALVIDGMLNFKNDAQIEYLRNTLLNKSNEEIDEWEESIGFKSIERASNEIIDEILCRAEQLVNNGMTQNEILAIFKSGDNEELTPELKNRIDILKMTYKKDNDGLGYLDYNIVLPFFSRFLNDDYRVIINDTVVKYDINKIELISYSDFKKGNFDNLIVVERIFGNTSSLKSLDFKKVGTLCHDTQNSSTHKLDADFIVERRIYQKPGCINDCIYTYSTAYIKYQGYYKRWIGWKKGSYILYYNGSFDVKEKIDGVTTTYNVPIYRTSHLGSPIELYSTDDRTNSSARFVAFGMVDCFHMSIASDFYCSFNIYPNGLNNGSVAGEGYNFFYQLTNDY